MFGLLLCLNLCACAARYVLSDRRLAEAQADGSSSTLRVYVSHRTITVYDRGIIDSTIVRKEIDRRKEKDRRKVKLGRNDSGIIVLHELLNGQRLLWVTFDPRCEEKGCAFGFVHTEDGRYRLVHLPERDGYAMPYVFRSCTLKRQKMALDRLASLSDANAVYKLKRKRKRRPKTVFLELKQRVIERTHRRGENVPGVDPKI